MPLQGQFLEDTGRLRQCHGDSFYLDLVVFKASCGGLPFVSLSEKSNTEVIQTQDGDMEFFGRYTRIIVMYIVIAKGNIMLHNLCMQ